MRMTRPPGRHPVARLWRTSLFILLMAQVDRPAPAWAHDPDEVLRVVKQGQATHAKGDYGSAERFHRQALEMARDVFGPDHPNTASCLSELGNDLERQGRFVEAERLQREALTIVRASGKQGPLLPAVLVNHGYVLDELGKLREAEALLREALEVSRDELGPNSPWVSTSKENLAKNLEHQGRLAEAETLSIEVLTIRRRDPRDPAGLARAATGLGQIFRARERLEESEALFLESLKADLEAFGPDHPETAIGLHNLALNFDDRGRHVEAEPLHRSALGIQVRRLGAEHPESLSTDCSLAACLGQQGKLVEAEALLRRALRIYARKFGPGHRSTTSCLNLLGMNALDQGHPGMAEALFRVAIADYRESFGSAHPSIATFLGNLAISLERQGRFDEAEPLYLEAIAAKSRALGAGDPATLTTRANLALGLTQQGRYRDAEPLLREILAAGRDAWSEDNPQLWSTMSTLAECLAARHADDEAETLLVEAARLHASYRRGAASGLDRGAIAGSTSPTIALALLAARRGQSEDAWRRFEGSLGRALLDEIAVREAGPRGLATKPGDANRPDDPGPVDLDAIRAVLKPEMALIGWLDRNGRGRNRGPDGGEDGEHWAFVLRSSGPARAIRIAGSEPGGAWTRSEETLGPALLQALGAKPVEARALAEELARLRLDPIAGALGAAGSLPAATHLLILPSFQLDGVPVEWLVELRWPASEIVVQRTPSGSFLARGSRAAQGRPAQVPRVLALGNPSPDGGGMPARQVPAFPDLGGLIAAVEVASPAAQFGLSPGMVLIEIDGQTVRSPADLPASGPSPATTSVSLTLWDRGLTRTVEARPDSLVGLRLDPSPAAVALRAAWEEGRLATVDPADGRLSWAQLPGSAAEVRFLGGLFGPSHATQLVGGGATRSALEALTKSGELARYRYIHLSSHGRADADRPFQSGLILTPERDGSGGWITAAEMRRWTLDADLVVLSACQSALGRPTAGEGYLGFAQALMAAGSRSVVVSLWDATDEASVLLFPRFYRNLLGRRPGLVAPMPGAAALQEAKRWLRDLTAEAAGREASALGAVELARRLDGLPPRVRPFADPDFWATFVLIGAAE